MLNFGLCANCQHQLCYAQATHLAVCDVLYKKLTFHETDVDLGLCVNCEHQLCYAQLHILLFVTFYTRS